LAVAGDGVGEVDDVEDLGAEAVRAARPDHRVAGPRRPEAVSRRDPRASQPVAAERRPLVAVSRSAPSTCGRAPALLAKQSRSGRGEAVGSAHGLPGRQRYVVWIR
jgi:hypothetical protein